MHFIVARASVVLVLIFFTGCGRPPSVAVSGTLKINGKPATGGVVWFSPDAGRGNQARSAAGATVGSEGEFELEEPIPAGAYRVTYRSRAPGMPTAEDYAQAPTAAPQAPPTGRPRTVTAPEKELSIEVTPDKTEYELSISN